MGPRPGHLRLGGRERGECRMNLFHKERIEAVPCVIFRWERQSCFDHPVGYEWRRDACGLPYQAVGCQTDAGKGAREIGREDMAVRVIKVASNNLRSVSLDGLPEVRNHGGFKYPFCAVQIACRAGETLVHEGAPPRRVSKCSADEKPPAQSVENDCFLRIR